MKDKFYITTAIPYVNAKPHIGHALEFVQADVIGRFHRDVLGEEKLLLSGADENALKNVQAAEKEGKPVQEFIDENARLFQELAERLHVQFDIFQKGSDREKHFHASQKLWQLCAEAGDIYKKTYEGLYCVGCESFYTREELNENGECFEHPGKPLETVSEENYFFRLSKYHKRLRKLITTDEIRIIPQKRKNEILAFLEQDLEDISISRSNERARNWGVPVPGDPTQRMYVWFDALNIYQSGIGFGWNEEGYQKWWPADVHVIGKGITRFHAVYWPAFLLSAGLELPKTIFVHEYFTVNGQKMSKTIGNVIDPLDLLQTYSTDAIRYYFLASFSPFSDGDFSLERFKEVYNADLANGLGNLVARVAAMAKDLRINPPKKSEEVSPEVKKLFQQRYEFDQTLAKIWKRIKSCDVLINEKRVWKLEGKEREEILLHLIAEIRQIASDLTFLLPDTAEKIRSQFTGPAIAAQPPLFPRIA